MSKNGWRRVCFYGSLVGVFLVLALSIKNPVFLSQAPAAGLLQASPARLREVVEALSSVNPARSYEHIESLEKAAEFISEAFAREGLAVSAQEFEVKGRKFRNVIAHLGPKEGDLLVIGAHYDVAGDQAGADDNASGVAGLIELARILSPIQSKLKRPIELVAYS
jgi:hypothetical protein